MLSAAARPSWPPFRLVSAGRSAPTLVAAMFIATVFAAPAGAQKGPASTGEKTLRYEELALSMGGHEVGRTVSQDIETAAGYRFVRRSELQIKRGATVIKMSTRGVSETDRNLVPQSFRFEKSDAAGTFVLEGRRDGKDFVLTSSGGGATEQRFALPKGMTFASAMEHLIRKNLKAGARLKRPVLIEEMGAQSEMEAAVERHGAGYKITAHLHGLVIEEETDAAGRTIVSRTPALGAVAYPPGLPPDDVKNAGSMDMLAASTWPAPRLDKNVKTVRYRVHTPDASVFSVPIDRRQKLIGRTADTVDIEVSQEPSTGPQKDLPAALSQATPYEAIEDAALRWLAHEVTYGLTSPRQKIAALNTFVFHHVEEKSLDRGYAPALSTLRSRAGDCTEHSVLLSALLRASGFPTRLVDGVVVDGGRAGYHEWVEVYVEGVGFIPTDPTFGEFPATPRRLKLAEGTSSPEGLLHLGISAGRILRPGVRIEVVSAK